MIDLRSDTVTTTDHKIREAMYHAPIADDAYGEDVNVQELEAYCRSLFKVEAALFTTSGMLSNRLALLSQTNRGDEVILDYNYHINFFDSAATAAICHVVLNTRFTKTGILSVEEIVKAIKSKPRYDYFAQPSLISVENTINGWVGKIFPFQELEKLSVFAKSNHLKIHLDGARLFNAHVETNIPLAEYARCVDTLSICVSKGLGAPFGSILMGSQDTIHKAKRYKMWLGSGFHQIGFYARAALHALQNNISRLIEDHQLTRYFANKLQTIEEINLHPDSAATNMIQFSIKNKKFDSEVFMDACQEKGLFFFPWLPDTLRAVVHKDINEENIKSAIVVIKNVITQLKKI